MNDYEKIGFRAYRIWLALRNHFNIEKFDYNKSRLKITEETYLKRKDWAMFTRLGNRYNNEIESFLISVYCRIGNGRIWVGEMLEDKFDKEFIEWKKRKATLLRMFADDVSIITEFMEGYNMNFRDTFQSVSGKLPPIVQFERKHLITPESLVIINRLTEFTSHIYSIHPAWDDIKFRLIKYQSFVKIKELGDYAIMLRTGTTTT